MKLVTMMIMMILVIKIYNNVNYDDNNNTWIGGKWQKFEWEVHCVRLQQLPEETFDARELRLIIYWGAPSIKTVKMMMVVIMMVIMIMILMIHFYFCTVGDEDVTAIMCQWNQIHDHFCKNPQNSPKVHSLRSLSSNMIFFKSSRQERGCKNFETESKLKSSTQWATEPLKMVFRRGNLNLIENIFSGFLLSFFFQDI